MLAFYEIMRNFAIVLLLLPALSACDLFRLRDSDPPTKPPLWNDFSTDWQKCMENLEFCYEDGRNVVKYSGLFTQDYSFHFSAQDANDYNIPQPWNRSQEQDMLINLHSQSDSIRIILEPLEGQNDDISANEARIYRKYTLNLYKAGVTTPEVYSGNLELQFNLSSGYWYISRWYDYRAYSHPTWGKMKYDYSQ